MLALVRVARQWCLLALMLALAGPVLAQLQVAESEEKAAPLAVPHPASLAPDWWAFFATAKPEEFQSRAEQFQEVLDNVSAGLTGADVSAGASRASIVEIHGLFDALVDAKERVAPIEVAADPVAPEAPTLSGLLQLAAQHQEAQWEAEFIASEAKEQARAVDEAKQRTDNSMASYLELPPASPERLASGLRIVQGRLLWALGVAELEQIRALEARRLAQVKTLAQQIEYGRDNLAPTSSPETWTAQRTAADEERTQFRAQAATARLRLASLARDARGQARRRLHQQQLIDLEAKILTADLRVAEADVAIFLLSPELIKDEQADESRAKRKTLDELNQQARAKLPVWRGATSRERDAANEQLSGDSPVPASLLHQRIAQADVTTKTLAQLRRHLARSDLLISMATKRLTSEVGQFDEWLAAAGLTISSLWSDFVSISTASLFTVNDTPVTALGLVRLSIIILIAWVISRVVGKAFERLMSRRETMTRASIYTLSRLFHYVILVVGFLIALSSIGIDFTKFALLASAFGVGLGFGLQAIFSNFVAGLIILFERSLKVGDYVELESGVGGEVQSISIRSTMVTTNDNVDILVPNSEFVNGRVTNWTLREAFRRTRIPFGVAYGTDKELVRKAALEAAAEVTHTFKQKGREPTVWLVGFGDSSLDFELVVWLTPDAVKRPGTVLAAYNWAIESALARYGIEIPFPQRDLHVRSVFTHKDADGMEAVASLASGKAPAAPPSKDPQSD